VLVTATDVARREENHMANGTTRNRGVETRRLPETKTFLATSEFWVCAIAIAALMFAAYVMDDIVDPTAWRYATWVAIGYIVSRGLAKAGSQRNYDEYRRAASGDDDIAYRRTDGAPYERSERVG
jgi:hypothetical protein